MDGFLNTWYGIVAFVAFDIIALTAVVCITYRWLFKRIFDVLASTVCLIVLSPVYLVIVVRGLLAKKKGEIPALLKAETFVGKKGRTVTLHTFERVNGRGEAGAYGKWLEKSKLYALARILDVFLGKLSFIGIKPFTQSEAKLLSEEDADRHIAKGGLINPLVKSGDAETDYEEMIASDKKYAWNFGFFGDCGLFFTWLLKKVRGEGSVYLGKTRERSYAKYLLDEGKITQKDYDAAMKLKK